MTALTLYLKDAAAGAFRALQNGGSAPATATTGTGWTVGTSGVGLQSPMASNVERAASTFVLNLDPPDSGPDATLGDGFRSENVLNGRFAAGNWTIPVPVIAVTAGGAMDGRVRLRLWRSPNADGSAATEITAGTQPGSLVTNLTTAEQISSLTVALDEFGLVDEYLFLSVAWRIAGAGGGATDDCLIRVGVNAAITTTDFVTATSTEYWAVLAGQGLVFQKGDYVRSMAQQFAAQVSSDEAGVRLGEATRVMPAWSGGAGFPNFDQENPTRYYQGLGVDISTTKDKAQVGPGLTASLSSARDAQRVFGLYNGELYVGASTGQVARQTATDTWTDPVGTLTSNPPVGVISYCPQGINSLSARMVVGAATSTGQVAGYDGTTFTNNIADADTASQTTARITRWTAGAIWVRSYNDAGSFLVMGGRPHSSIAAARNIGDIYSGGWAAFNSPFNNGWTGQGSYGTSGQISAIVPVYGASSSVDILLYVEVDLTAIRSIVKRVESAVGSYVQSVVQELTDDAILSGVAVGTTVYFSTYRGRIYSYDATGSQSTLVLVATGVSSSDANIYGLAAWNEALWVACRSGTSLIVRRYGSSDPLNAEAEPVWSSPIYGGTIDASATAARQAIAFGGDLYVATEAAGASKVYRMRSGVYNTSPVTLQTGELTFDSAVIVTSVKLEHSALVTSDSVQLKYARNGSATYNSLGTNSTVGSTSSWYDVAASGKVTRLSIQAVITAGSSAATPQLGRLTVVVRPIGEVTREWTITVQMFGTASLPDKRKDGSSEPHTGQVVDDSLWAIFEEGVTQRFRDMDGHIYTVTVSDFSDHPEELLAHNQNLRWSGSLTLREV